MKYPFRYHNDVVGLLYASRNKRLAKKILKKEKAFFRGSVVSYTGGPRVFRVNDMWEVWEDGYGPGYGLDPVKL